MNVAHRLGIKHAQWIASLNPGSEVEAGDLHDLHYPFITGDWFGNADLEDDYWTAFWITLEDLSDEN